MSMEMVTYLGYKLEICTIMRVVNAEVVTLHFATNSTKLCHAFFDWQGR